MGDASTTPTASPPGLTRRTVTRLVRWTVRLVVGAVLLVLVGLVTWAFQSRGMPDLQPWHERDPEAEFQARMAGGDFDFDDYRSLEDRIFGQLEDWQIPAARSGKHLRHNRFIAGGPGNPTSFETNWNRSVEIAPEGARGAVLLIHGLSDGPYSMHSLAALFAERGFYVLALRLPGHGTVPAGLLDVDAHDWIAAVDIAARHVQQQAGNGPYYVAGYSCGGALATLLALQALEDESLTVPDRVFLFSPAIGITALAQTSNWHKLLSWADYFEKSRWLSIEPEFDPFKYNSFTKNAGAQMWALTQIVQAELARLAGDGRIAAMPPFLTFQSVVDATIVGRDVVEQLYARLPENGSELVALDVNTRIYMDGFYTQDTRAGLRGFEEDDTMPYRFTLVTNENEGGDAVTARTTPPFSNAVEVEALTHAWPPQVYSLSHVAIPFPPDDPLYGYRDPATPVPETRLKLGQLALRGESNVLSISAASILRLRSNPFHDYMHRRIVETIEADG